MAKRIDVQIYSSTNAPENWILDQERTFQSLWDLHYGENPQQPAMIFQTDNMAKYEVIDGKILSYNEILSLTEIANVLSEFFDVYAAVIVKHAAPCGVALGATLDEAYNKAFDCDPISSFFGAIGTSKTIDYEVAKHINSMSVKMVLAPDFEPKALDLLRENPFIKLIKLNTPLSEYKSLIQKEVHITPFGTLYQDFNKSELNKNSFKVVTQTKPTKEQIEDAVFAWKISKYARSNSIVIAKDFKTVAISQGHVSPVTAVESAMHTACDNAKGAIMASDNTLPTSDCIYAALPGRISTIIQPGGSANDAKMIELADKYHIAMIFTGIKNYKH